MSNQPTDVLTTVVLASDINEAYAKARLDARAFFGEGPVQVQLVEAEVETSARDTAAGQRVAGPQFGCRFTARRAEGQPLDVDAVWVADVAVALIDSRAAYQLADNFTPNQSQMHDAVSLVHALERRGYQIIRKDSE